MEKRFISCKPITFGNGHKDPSSPYCQFKSKIKKNLKGLDFSGFKKVSVNFCVYLDKNRDKPKRNDLDNFAKAVLDALHEAKVIKNERQVFSIYMKKVFVNGKDREGMSIQIK